MTYAYGQVPLHLLTAKRCNFQSFEDESTSTYRFVIRNGMLQSVGYVMDILPARFREVSVFIDDFLIVTKRDKEEQLDKVRENLKTLDQAELKLMAEKCTFAKNKIEWPGFN